MASGNSGTLTSAQAMPRQYRTLHANFSWNITNVNADAGTATLNYRVYLSGTTNIKYRVFGVGDRNFLRVNGNTVFAFDSIGTGTYNDPYKTYCREGQHRMTPFKADGPPNWTFIGWTLWYGILAEGSMTIYYDDDGNCSFSVYGAFQCFTGAASDDRIYIDDTVTIDKVERNSNVALKQGGAWNTKGGNIWYKNGSWSKKNLYHKENGTWVKR